MKNFSSYNLWFRAIRISRHEEREEKRLPTSPPQGNQRRCTPDETNWIATALRASQ
jgi:hypothetical protein